MIDYYLAPMLAAAIEALLDLEQYANIPETQKTRDTLRHEILQLSANERRINPNPGPIKHPYAGKRQGEPKHIKDDA